MAKDPKLGGLRPGDENYKLLLEGIAKRQEAAAKAQEEAAKAQETAASSVEVTGQLILPSHYCWDWCLVDYFIEVIDRSELEPELD